MRLVTLESEVWRLSDAAYRKLLRGIANGSMPTMSELKAKSLGVVECNVTDMSPDVALDYLKQDED